MANTNCPRIGWLQFSLVCHIPNLRRKYQELVIMISVWNWNVIVLWLLSQRQRLKKFEKRGRPWKSKHWPLKLVFRKGIWMRKYFANRCVEYREPVDLPLRMNIGQVHLSLEILEYATFAPVMQLKLRLEIGVCWYHYGLMTVRSYHGRLRNNYCTSYNNICSRKKLV